MSKTVSQNPGNTSGAYGSLLESPEEQSQEPPSANIYTSEESDSPVDMSHKERGQSAPAKFDQSMINHFGVENDLYAK